MHAPAAPLASAPPALDAGNGRPAASGRYRGAIGDLSTAAWDGGGRRRLQRKAWIYLSACTARYSVGYAIVDAGLIATAFVYVFDRETKKLVEEKATLPFGFASSFAPDWRRPWQLARAGKRWQVTPDAARGWQVRFESARLRLALDVERGGEGLTAISSAPGRPFHHTWKLCAVPSTLRFTLDGVAVDVPASSAIDFTLGYPPRSSLWNWASLDGAADDGRKLGLNLVAHFMNGLENGLWLDGELLPLAQASFAYDPANLMAAWRLRTEDGIVDIRFTPEGQRTEHLNALVLRSQFAQPFGRFEGHVGQARVRGFGVVEEHRALW
ncbi:DUF2804 domain-containing protein [Nevskia sp.]|uniref:DUF2804 domain-containing protein n=1 Tax=Nevskia sp. TaxID=1929292 RepID=UPI0026011EAF|nr:DUF2804 domain-containing protein [Nevskia sp.]